MVLGLRKAVVLRVKQATMDFVVWVLQHANDSQMAAMAPIAYKGIMSTLQVRFCCLNLVNINNVWRCRRHHVNSVMSTMCYQQCAISTMCDINNV